MQWSKLFGKEKEPSVSQIEDYVETPLWSGLDNHIQEIYNVKPKLSYSGCSMDSGMWKGWNVKYKKGGKALCTVYPKQGYLLMLVPIGLKDMTEAELVMPLCTEYTQNLFKQAKTGHTGKSLAFEVKDESVLKDVKQLIALRVKKKAA